MLQIIERLQQKVSLLKVGIFLAVFLLALFIINGEAVGVARLVKLTGGVGILDLVNGYSVDKAYEMLSGMGAEGRAFYLSHIIPMDFIFPLTYMLFYASVMLYILKHTPATSKWMNLVLAAPVLNALFDYIENVLIIIMLNSYPQKLIGITQAADIATRLKFNLVSFNAAAIVFLLANLIIKKYLK